MSHRAVVQTQYNDVAAMSAAAEALGQKLTEGGMVRMYGGARERADYTITLDGPYDVGFLRDGDSEGNFKMLCDSEVMHEFDNGRNNVARRVFGSKLQRFTQEYSFARVAMQQRMRGRAVNKVGTLENGVVHVQVTGW